MSDNPPASEDSTVPGALEAQAHEREERLSWLLFFVVALLLGYLSLRTVDSPDYWWHVSMGKATLEAGSATFADPLAASSNQEYVNIVWLFDLPLYLVHRAGGLVAVNLCIALLTMVSYLMLVLLAREVAFSRSESDSRYDFVRGSPWMPLVLATLVAGATHLRFIPRPQAVFLTFLPLVLWLAFKSTRVRGKRQWIPLAVALMVIWAWARMHASVIIAPLVFAAGSIRLPVSLDSLEIPRPKQLLAKLSPVHWAALVLSVLLPFTGPSGFDLLRRVLDHGDSFAVRHITEMQPMSLDLWFAPTRDIFFAEVLALIALIGLWRRRWFDLPSLCLGGLGLYLTLGTNRFSSAWAVMLLPMAVQGLRGLAAKQSPAVSRCLALVASAMVVGMLFLSSSAPDFEADAKFREDAPQAIQALVSDGVMFNDYDIGGYLGLELNGRPRVLIDSRSQMHFTDEEHYSAMHALRQPAVFDALHRLHGFSAAYVPKSTPLCNSLQDRPSWSAAWFSETRVLFVPRTPATGPAFAQPEAPPDVSFLEPCAPRAALPRCRAVGLSAAIAAVENMRSLTPGNPYLARQSALMHLQCSAPPNLAAADAAVKIAARDPAHADYRWIEGSLLLAQGQFDAAEASLAMAPEQHLAAQSLRLQALRQQGRSAEALTIARPLVIAFEDRDLPRLRELLAWACEEESEIECAVRESLRAAQSHEPAARQRLERLLAEGQVPADLEPLANAVLSK